MLTEDELKAIEARAVATTPGQWRNVGNWHIAGDGFVGLFEDRTNFNDGRLVCGIVGPGKFASANCDFILNARPDIATLISEVRRLQDEIKQARQAALEEAAQICETSSLGLALAPNIVRDIAHSIRALKTGVGLHASQQPHAGDGANDWKAELPNLSTFTSGERGFTKPPRA